MSAGPRSRLAARAAVATGAVSRRLGLGSGSVIGGRVGLALDPRLLDVLAVGRQVALVSGTNGKTTTTRLLAQALRTRGPVATSAAGANLPPGVAVALSAAPPGAPAVLEVDEGYLPALADRLHPAVVCLLNLSRDQLDRVSEVRMVAGRWRAAAARFGTVVANADDPLVAWAAEPADRVVWVAAGQLWRADAGGCPVCGGRILFDAAGWRCEGCAFARPRPDATVADDALVLPDGRRLELRLALPGRFNRANAAVAAVAAARLGVDEGAALGAMAAVDDVEGRFATVTDGGVTARLLLAKNPAGWAELLDLVAGDPGPVVVAINARVADGHDPSWLWDVDFERLAGRTVVAAGERCRDLAVRLRYAGVDHAVEPDPRRALAVPGAPRVEFIGNYTAFQDLRRALRHPAGPARPAPTVATARPVPTARRAGPDDAGGPGRGADRSSALRVVVVHPDLLGTYGDGGNGRVLAARAAWRELDVDLVLVHAGDPVPASGDLYCLGGGEDGPEVKAAELLGGGVLRRAVDGGAAVLAVCAGFQLAGTAFPDASGARRDGLGLLDVATTKGTGRRAVGEVVADPDPDASWPVRVPALTGFENHSGVTRLGPGARPLAAVRVGRGNGGGDGSEGAWAGRVVGTYLHGPVLARNPALADLLLALATGVAPRPLDDAEEAALRDERLVAAGGPGRRRVRRYGRAA